MNRTIHGDNMSDKQLSKLKQIITGVDPLNKAGIRTGPCG